MPGISHLLILVLQQTWKELVFSHFADKETEVQGDYGTLWQVHSLLEAGLDFKPKSPWHQSPGYFLFQGVGGSQQRPDHQEPYELAKKGKLDPLNSGKTWKTFK